MCITVQTEHLLGACIRNPGDQEVLHSILVKALAKNVDKHHCLCQPHSFSVSHSQYISLTVYVTIVMPPDDAPPMILLTLDDGGSDVDKGKGSTIDDGLPAVLGSCSTSMQ